MKPPCCWFPALTDLFARRLLPALRSKFIDHNNNRRLIYVMPRRQLRARTLMKRADAARAEEAIFDVPHCLGSPPMKLVPQHAYWSPIIVASLRSPPTDADAAPAALTGSPRRGAPRKRHYIIRAMPLPSSSAAASAGFGRGKAPNNGAT